MLKRALVVCGVLLAGAACDSPVGVESKRKPAAIDVAPANPSLVAADTLRFKATVRDSAGKLMDDVTVSWASSDPARLQIGADGLAKVLVEPTTTEPPVTVTASAGSVSGTTDVKLKWQLLDIFPDTNVLFSGMTRRLNARMINSFSGPSGADFFDAPVSTWVSSDPSIASVDANGVMTAKAVGQARIRGTLANGRTATAELYVKAAPSLRFVDASGAHATFMTLQESRYFGPELAPHGCGLTDTGDVYCWGVAFDAVGPTDRCERTYRLTPVVATYMVRRFRCSEIPYRLASPVIFTSLAARGDMGCGVATSRKIYCWGRTGTALGSGVTDTSYHGVTAIASNDDFISVHVPEVSTLNAYDASPVCGLRADRVLVCWGASFGSNPTAVGTMTWRAISGSGRCGIAAADSTAWCFTTGSAQRFGGTSRWASVSAQQFQVCLTDLTGQPSCGPASGPGFGPLTGVPSLVSLETYSAVVRGTGCGLTSSFDLYCAGAFPANGGAKIDLGVQLKRFFGNCGIGVDDRAYCWLIDPATGVYTFRRIPGQ